MFSTLALIIRDRSLRIMTLILILTGFTYAATIPYFSIVATREFGLSDGWLSALTFSIAFGNLIVGVSLSVVSDWVKDRKLLMLATNLAGIVGFGLIFALPSLTTFLFCSLSFILLASSNYSLVFGAVRAYTIKLDPVRAAPVNSAVRAAFAASWILVPGLVALLLIDSKSMLPAWGFASAACGMALLINLLFLPANQAAPAATGQKMGFAASLRQMMTPVLLGPIIFMALVTGTTRLLTILAPLIVVTRVGGAMTDVGFIAGGTAALEIPFMLMWGSLLKRHSVLNVLTAGTIIYAGYMLLLGFASTTWQIYALMIPSACGAAAVLSLPMTYLQDLVAEKPGLGTSLFQLSNFISFTAVSAIFAIGAAALGYSGTAWLGAAMGLVGIAGLLITRQSGNTSDSDLAR